MDEEDLIPTSIIHIIPGQVPIIYKRYEELGHGGFAKVYRAVNRNTGEEVAIKITSKDRLWKPKAMKKHKFEVEIQKSLHHPNVVKAYDFFEDQLFTYLVLELCPGGTLKSLIKKKTRLTEQETIKYVGDILNGLAYIHDNNIIHRDIKLENFLIDKDGHIKIADFGLSAKIKYEGQRKHTVCGTPNYISPELLLDQEKGISYEVDIWALGVSIYAMLTGKLPFQARKTEDTYEKIKKCDYQFPSDIHLSIGATMFVQYLLNLNPIYRPTAHQLKSYPWLQNGSTYHQRPTLLEVQNSVSTSSDDSKQYKTSNFDDPAASKVNIYNDNRIFNNNIIVNNILNNNNINNNVVNANTNTNNVNEIYNNINFDKEKEVKVVENDSQEMSLPKYFVSRFCDYSEKYGLGYLLLNGCVGVCFKDCTRMVMDPHHEFIQYWRTFKDEKPEILDINDIEEERKIRILFKFSSSLKKTKTMFEIPEEKCDPNVPLLHVKYWSRNEEATLFRMNNRNIQLNFQDRKKLIIFWNSRKLMIVPSIYDSGHLYRIHDVLKKGDDDDMKTRLVFAKQVLAEMSRPLRKETLINV